MFIRGLVYASLLESARRPCRLDRSVASSNLPELVLLSDADFVDSTAAILSTGMPD